MAPEAVQPLRINKTTSPYKMSSPSVARPLSEIGLSERRRNSPSFNQSTTKLALTGESSPFDSSPATYSSRKYWVGQNQSSPTRSDTENVPFRDLSSSPTRRISLEKLQQASRVKNSSMFAREQYQKYDPARVPTIERPLANRAPLSVQLQDNASEVDHVNVHKTSPIKGHRQSESSTTIPRYQISNSVGSYRKSTSPSRDQNSPTKSSMSASSRFTPITFDAEEGMWSDDEHQSRAPTPRAMLRHTKSVTFDKGPPQVNEYELITPDPSSVASGSREGSFDSEAYEFEEESEQGSDIDRDDSFDESLADLRQTPVVLPEDWRFMSPKSANLGLAESFEDPFKGRECSPSPFVKPIVQDGKDQEDLRSGSLDSNGNPRPLPPLPYAQRDRSDSNSHSMANDLFSKNKRSLPSPPRPSSVSKAEILKMRESPIPLDERLRLLSVQEQTEALKLAQELNEANEADPKAIDLNATDSHAQKAVDNCELGRMQGPPRISRESILRQVNSSALDNFFGTNDLSKAAPVLEHNDIDYSNVDPDFPIPSREISSAYEQGEQGLAVEGSEGDDSSVLERSSSHENEYDRESSVVHHGASARSLEVAEGDPKLDQCEGDDASDLKTGGDENEEFSTPRPEPAQVDRTDSHVSSEHGRMSLPEFSFHEDDFGFNLRSYTSPSPPPVIELCNKEVQIGLVSELPVISRVSTPGEESQSAEYKAQEALLGTPDSVIRHSVHEEDSEVREIVRSEILEVPEPVATIKAPGSKLKTRPSATPADLQAMAATRRQISGDHNVSLQSNSAQQTEESDETVDAMIERNRSLRMQLDVSVSEPDTNFSLSLDNEFDRLLEAKKKGYLMRQNTKVIVASNRLASGDKSQEETKVSTNDSARVTEKNDSRLPENGLRKPSAQTWTTEPWNGRVRRQSIRHQAQSPEKKGSMAPHLKAHERNLDGLENLPDNEINSLDDDNGERGRLFVKVIGAKELDLPLPNNERSWFQLTLDNGLHCVTTAWLELGRTAPIGQEFELVVFEDLEFQLTLQTKLERPKSQAGSVNSINKVYKAPPKPPAFSRLFTSPKKRREMERRQQEEEAFARKQELEVAQMSLQPTAWDLLHNLVAPDGSFARAYVCLKNHEDEAFGRPINVDIPCWNEWAVEETIGGSSTRSKLGGIQRKPPYKIGKIELQLLYVPKPRGMKDEDMPKSMSACIRELKEAEMNINRQFEGHLSQQGGDCPYWRRRFFKLDGSKLTAYHESTRQPRATINLAKATKLIDDKSSLTKSAGISKTTTKGGRGRRKSAFAEDEEGYMFVEEGFRIRFANGEVIDFYAENTAAKVEWMKVLSEVVGKDHTATKTTWTSLVLAKECNKRGQKAPEGERKSKTMGEKAGSQSVSSSPVKRNSAATTASQSSGTHSTAASSAPSATKQPPPIEKSPRHTAITPHPRQNIASPTKASSSPMKSPVKPHSPSKTKLPTATPREKKVGNPRRALVKSMIF